MKRKITWIGLLLIGSGAVFNCQSVREYQKMNLNDSEMELAAQGRLKNSKPVLNATVRVPSGANGGKNGGGCGCN